MNPALQERIEALEAERLTPVPPPPVEYPPGPTLDYMRTELVAAVTGLTEDPEETR